MSCWTKHLKNLSPVDCLQLHVIMQSTPLKIKPLLAPAPSYQAVNPTQQETYND